eukprot:347990-Pelagomonas_calceolata.AAC.1
MGIAVPSPKQQIWRIMDLMVVQDMGPNKCRGSRLQKVHKQNTPTSKVSSEVTSTQRIYVLGVAH